MKNEIRILSDLKKNTDHYEWKELNCFYKPVAIIFSYFCPEYYNQFLLLLSIHILYDIQDGFQYVLKQRESIYEEFFKHYNQFMRNDFGIYINEWQEQDNEHLKNRILEELDKGFPVLVPIDLYEIYYDDNYKRVHAPHYIIIKGYDQKRKLFYILDTLHIENGEKAQYADFKMEMGTLLQAAVNNVFWSFQEEQAEPETNMEEVILNTWKQVLSEEKVYIDMEIFQLKTGMDKKINTNEYATKCNMRSVFYDILLQKITELVPLEERRKIEKKQKEIIKAWGKFSRSVFYDINKNDFDFRKEKEKAAVIEHDGKLLEKQIYQLLVDNRKAPKKNGSNYLIRNNDKAQIQVKERSIFIKHDKKQLANLWLTMDDAPQVLYKVRNQQEFQLQTGIHIKSLGNAVDRTNTYQSGLIVRMKNGHKYLFGLEKGECLSVLCPETELSKSLPYEKDFIKVRVCKQGEWLIFEYQNMASDWQVLKKVEEKGDMHMAGFFSKTWYQISHKVEFSEISF